MGAKNCSYAMNRYCLYIVYFLSLYISVCVGPGRKPRKTGFLGHG